MFCSRCGTSLADGSQFCVECGHTVEASLPPAPPTVGETVCSRCNKSVFSGARFCPNCGSTTPPPTIIAGDTGSAAAAATAYEPTYWRARRRLSRSKLLLWLVVIVVLSAAGWVATSNDSVAAQIKQYLITAHTETIADGSVAIKPHGFMSYRVSVPEGAIDVVVSGQFDASGRAESDVQACLLTEAEFVIWQGGYATSPFYDSGKVSQADMQAPLPSRPGIYYLVFSNKPSRVEKTVHVTAGLHYDTWLPDSVMYLKHKVWGWFE